MSKEWLITLEGYKKDGTIVEYKYYKDGEEYQLIRHNENTSAPKISYKSNNDLVKDVLNEIADCMAIKEVPAKYSEFWRKKFRERNRKYPTYELLD